MSPISNVFPDFFISRKDAGKDTLTPKELLDFRTNWLEIERHKHPAPTAFHINTDQHSLSVSNVPISAVSYAQVGTMADCVVAAAVGDVIGVAFSSAWAAVAGIACNVRVDAATWVSGAAVTYLSGGTGTGDGIAGWQFNTDNVGTHARLPIGGGALLTLAAGDISGGNVTVRLLAKDLGGNGGTLLIPLIFSVVNYKH